MSKIQASALVSLFRQALDEKWGYIWGKSGQVWTQASQDAATREMTVLHGQKWVGRRVADCSGLFVWAFKKLGAAIYHGSNTIWNKYTDPVQRGAVAGEMSIHPGTAVFMVNEGRRTHIGLYVGGGKCIEAQGTRTGVVESDLSHWDEWGELTDVEYDLPAETVEIAMPILRKGNSGSAVETLQNGLLIAGYDVGKSGADGKFGAETLSAVRAFQSDKGLTPDGIVGPLTWAAIKAVTADDEPEEDKPDDVPVDEPDVPQEPAEDATATPALTIEERLTRLEKAVFGAGGGVTNV